MPDKSLPDQPNLEQYKKQAKDLVRAHAQASPEALDRIARHQPRPGSRSEHARFQLADALLVIAREHGFESWPKFAQHIETLRLTHAVASLNDPASAFIEAACSPRNGHRSGTLDEAEMILARYPHVAASSIYTASILADETSVKSFLGRDPANATAKGGPLGWDALTYLCFSRYLRLDRARSDAFVSTARAL
ncbi:MAG TPA: hypothetical protein VFW83_06010, partial [Bryobacteraceae bacterium]|nr:hypothetical protein [Bryobacteraceae bacterium]